MNSCVRSCSFIAVAVLVALPVRAQDHEDAVKEWLDRMNVAAEKLNYRGTFVHVVDGNAEEHQIAHRYFEGLVREKISSGGSGGSGGSEIVQTEDAVWSVFPEQRLVMVEERGDQSMTLASSVSFSDELDRYYQMTTFPRGSVADKDTQIVSIRARDAYRYGYLLWLDRDTALPLKVQVRDDEGTVIESLIFTEIEVVDLIPESDVELSLDLEGYTFRRTENPQVVAKGSEFWGATRLPVGFKLSVIREGMMAGSPYPVQHLVYTDGLASVSVFIAHPESEPDIAEGYSRFGSRNAYSLDINGRRATAIGDVPGRTVRTIATSLDAR